MTQNNDLISEQRMSAMHDRLNAALSPSLCNIKNESHKHIGHAGAKTGRGHFHLTIQSDALDGMSRIEQHRMIYSALGEMMETDIHALIIKIIRSS